MVHRGTYEAAKALYAQVLPAVQAHVASRGAAGARLRLTGHSLGGSLATLLGLMLELRGAVPAGVVQPVLAFGAPSVMCGGDALLARLGLPRSHVQSVVMAGDIVPRAFACDYPDHVAEVLRRINGAFRSHSCLSHQKHMYAPVGTLVMLQPEERLGGGPPPHPLLPEGAGLYHLRHPDNVANAPASTSPAARELRTVQHAFLNRPHPLEILADRSAYGHGGAIARSHDPCSYIQAVTAVLRQEMRRWRRLQREQRRQLWWPLVGAEVAPAASTAAPVGGTSDSPRPGGTVTSRIGGRSRLMRSSSSMSTVAAGAALPATGLTAVHGCTKRTTSRYHSVIASQHVQLGLLAVLTSPLFLAEGLSSLLV
eukprot:SM000197S05459  [mRNA]  locus=s197:201142:202245:+ [translate_table: standard]